jgi:ubiquinone/menaquinone biosynthesis C-methylase UbiE
MPTLPKALAEFRRVLKPGGVLLVTVWKSLPRWPYLHTILSFCNGGLAGCAEGVLNASRSQETLQKRGPAFAHWPMTKKHALAGCQGMAQAHLPRARYVS